ncbi:hypothetical protein AND_007243 [Anopheles darlingi]|uniref:Uncharacterized protein n=1 Tax=Anopheles darlingi TaxID=43151 RepID=W5JCP7_ANODA|nr:hypothetical protein AND_007243 [Anopheles darlingi]
MNHETSSASALRRHCTFAHLITHEREQRTRNDPLAETFGFCTTKTCSTSTRVTVRGVNSGMGGSFCVGAQTSAGTNRK